MHALVAVVHDRRMGQRAAGVGQPAPVPVQAAEGVLDHVLGRRPVAEHEVGQPDQAHGLGAVQRPNRRLGSGRVGTRAVSLPRSG